MDNLDKLARLKKEAGRLQREADKATGAYERTLAQIEEVYGCTTLAEATALCAKLGRQEKKAETKFNRALRIFEKKWKGVLRGQGD